MSPSLLEVVKAERLYAGVLIHETEYRKMIPKP